MVTEKVCQRVLISSGECNVVTQIHQEGHAWNMGHKLQWFDRQQASCAWGKCTSGSCSAPHGWERVKVSTQFPCQTNSHLTWHDKLATSTKETTDEPVHVCPPPHPPTPTHMPHKNGKGEGFKLGPPKKVNGYANSVTDHAKAKGCNR